AFIAPAANGEARVELALVWPAESDHGLGRRVESRHEMLRDPVVPFLALRFGYLRAARDHRRALGLAPGLDFIPGETRHNVSSMRRTGDGIAAVFAASSGIHSTCASPTRCVTDSTRARSSAIVSVKCVKPCSTGGIGSSRFTRAP